MELLTKTIAKIELYLAQIDFPGDLTQLPEQAYLVGGSVRDAVLQRYKLPVDLDFVLPEKAIATAKLFANLYDGGFVVLDHQREIARVVFAQGTLDLAKREGTSLEQDLYRRDFTINAIAYNLKLQQLVDPLEGLKDLQQGVLRMVAVSNLEDDPLRLLRAYRQAAQLNFTIEAKTRTAISDRSTLLKIIAAERVQAELNYLLTADHGNKWLLAAIQDGLFDFWLPHSSLLDLEQLEAVDQGIEFCFKSGLSASELPILAKLSTLVTPDFNLAEVELTQLKYARNQIKAVCKTVKYLPSLQQMTQLISLRQLYFWYLAVKDIFPILIARAIAVNVPQQIIVPLMERYLDPHDPVAHPQCLVTGNDLLQRLHLKPSPIIGELLTEIQIAQIESKVATVPEAIEFAHGWLQSQVNDCV